MIWSVSTLARSSGATFPVRVVNGCTGEDSVGGGGEIDREAIGIEAGDAVTDQ